MQINLNTIQVFTVPDNFASLESASNLEFQYKFTLNVSKTQVLNTGAGKLIIRTYLTDPRSAISTSILSQPANQTPSIVNQNVSKIIQNIQQRSFTATTDTVSVRTNYLTSEEYGLNGLINRYNTGVGYTVIDPTSTIQSVDQRVHNIPNKLVSQELRDDRTISQLSEELLNTYKVDPATAIQKLFSTQTAYESNNGVATSYKGSLEAETIEQRIVGSLLSTNVSDEFPEPVVQTYDISGRDIIPVFMDMTIPRSVINNTDFYVMFSLYNSDKELVQETVKFVRHISNLSILQAVMLPPKMSITKRSGGILSFEFQQVDPNAAGIKIYKTVYNHEGNNSPVVQSFVGNYDLTPNSIRVVDIQNNSLGLVLYRALAYGADGSISSDFSSQVLEIHPNDVTSFSKSNQFLILHSQNVLNGLNISVSEIPQDISFVKLYRSIIENTLPINKKLLTTFFVGGLGSGTSYSYTDDTVEQYRQYQYTCELVDIKGQESSSSAMVEVYYRKQDQSYATVNTTAPVVTPVNRSGDATQYFDVAFSVNYAIKPTLEDSVRSLLASQGLSEYYGADINRDNLRQLLTTKVELRNLHTNDVYFMGFINTDYVQSSTNFGLLDQNARYVYVLTTYVRNPQTLIESITKTGKSTPRLSGNTPTYTYVPFNVEHPYGLLTGTNPKSSGTEFTKQFGIDQLAFGDITSYIEIEVDLKPPVPTVNGLRALVFNEKTVELNWFVNGSQDGISHFIVRRENVQTNKIDLIGKAHGINVRNSFTYVDPIRYTETGVYRYIITMQNTDLSLSEDFVSNEIVI